MRLRSERSIKSMAEVRFDPGLQEQAVAEPMQRVEHRLTEYEALIAAAPTAFEAIPGAVYVCDRDGWLVRFNSEAARAMGQNPGNW